jgi:hypothetical protein
LRKRLRPRGVRFLFGGTGDITVSIRFEGDRHLCKRKSGPSRGAQSIVSPLLCDVHGARGPRALTLKQNPVSILLHHFPQIRNIRCKTRLCCSLSAMA